MCVCHRASDLTILRQLDLLTTGQGAQQRKMRGDLRREVLNILENRDAANKGMRWTEVAAALDEQSSIVRVLPPSCPLTIADSWFSNAAC